MEIRRLTGADVPSLLRLYRQLSPEDEFPTEDAAADIWQQIEAQESIIYLGAVEAGEVVSTCFLAIIPNLCHGGQSICLVENVVTDEKYRRQGLGRRVMQEAVRIAREQGCYKVMLQSAAYRTGAHRFYEEFGFDRQRKLAFDLRLE
ncbi:MAG: GNAT family N-acetyltransferase [Clostridia bacterium]|nr:GNAT family N-acetyltransferase [Clostridia bacterium]